MFDQAGFSKMFDILKKKGYYSQFADYESFKAQQAKDKEQIEKDAADYNKVNNISQPAEITQIPF